MLVWIVWGTAAGFALVVLAILGFGLYGQLGRLRRAVLEVQSELAPAARALQSDASAGRHRAG